MTLENVTTAAANVTTAAASKALDCIEAMDGDAVPGFITEFCRSFGLTVEHDIDDFFCHGVRRMPFEGNELLVSASLFLALIVTYTCTFLDVGMKQMNPKKYLHHKIQAQIKRIKKKFPGVDYPEGRTLEVNPKTDPDNRKEVRYNRVLSQVGYISTGSVDEDCIFPLVNNSAYATISGYSACTTRGYTMLSTFLLLQAFYLVFMWSHNSTIYSIEHNRVRYFDLIGYILCIFTGIVMTHPGQNAVYRTRSIIMWGSVGTGSKILLLHQAGIMGYIIIPMLSHSYQLNNFDNLPNRRGIQMGVIAQLIGLFSYAIPLVLGQIGKMDKVFSCKCTFLGEVAAVLLSDISYVQIEFFPTAVCGKMYFEMIFLMYLAIVGPLFFVCILSRWFAWVHNRPGAPGSGGYTKLEPCVMLGYEDEKGEMTLVAGAGPFPILNFNRAKKDLPRATVAYNLAPGSGPDTSDSDDDDSGSAPPSPAPKPKRASSSRKKKNA